MARVQAEQQEGLVVEPVEIAETCGPSFENYLDLRMFHTETLIDPMVVVVTFGNNLM